MSISLSCISKANLLSTINTLPSIINRYLSKSFGNNSIQVGFTEDGETAVCIHPEPTFPYEHSKPLPKKLEESDSVIKMTDEQRDDILFPKKLTDVDLVRLTHTAKLTWSYRPFYDRRNLKKLRDREGI